MSLPRTIALAATCAVALIGRAAGVEFSELVVFGDSGSDSGNAWLVTSELANRGLIDFALPQSPPYFEGRWSNGPMWDEIAAEWLGLPPLVPSLAGGANYAFASARLTETDPLLPAPSVLDQIGLYLVDGRTFREDELVVIQGGINDLAGQKNNAPDLGAAARRVADLGAKYVALATVPAALPLLQQTADLDAVERFNQLTVPQAAAELRARGVTTYLIDVDAVVNEVLTKPKEYGFADVNSPACRDCRFDVAVPSDVADDPNGFIWFDETGHLTAPMQQLLARRAVAVVPEPPSMVVAALCIACFAALNWGQVGKFGALASSRLIP